MDAIHGMQIGQWLGDVGSRAPVPGGGAVAGVMGAHSAALLQMVCAYTDELGPVHAELEGHRDAMLRLAEEDMQAFGEVSAAYAMPRDTDEAKRARSAAIQEGLRGAMATPVRTLEACAALAQQLESIVTRSNRNVISDAGIALVLLQATMDAAMYNVRVNAKFLKDAEHVTAQTRAADDAHARGSELIRAARELVDAAM